MIKKETKLENDAELKKSTEENLDAGPANDAETESIAVAINDAEAENDTAAESDTGSKKKTKMKKNTVIIIALCVAIIASAAALLVMRAMEPKITGNVISACINASSQVSDEAEKEKIAAEKARKEKEKKKRAKKLAELEQKLNLRKEIRDEFVHGKKGKKYQKYIVIHDTDGGNSCDEILSGWLNQGKKIASHFVVGRDGTVMQCVSLDKIAHHAGFGDKGHNEQFEVTDESRDDKAGTQSIGSDYPDYGMNSYSVGIELVHAGTAGEAYPTAQLEALDQLIAYIDTYFGKKSKIIDHKTWRTNTPDTSAEFADYLKNYKDHRKHN